MLRPLLRLPPLAAVACLASAACGLAACSDYEVNGKADVPPGEAVDDCVSAIPAPYAVSVDGDCAFEPPEGGFSPVVEWQWAGSPSYPGYEDVMMTPVVGDVDRDGMPEILFNSYGNNAYGSAGVLMMLSGDGAGEEAAWASIGGYTPSGSGGVALGDLDADGVPEIVTISSDLRVLALHADGTLVWASEPRSGDYTVYSYPSLADLDGDGLVEVVVGRVVLNHDGTLRGVGGYGYGGGYAISVVYDLDGDGQQEVVVGNAAYAADGTALWVNASLPDGWPAVGDFDDDGQGEIVVVGGGGVYLVDTDGTIVWGPQPVPGGGGGPPTVADFDGDGEPEVGVAGLAAYAVWDTDGTELWQQATQDASSAQTGSSVFDFEGDGAWEVVYADELVLRVYDGATGTVKLAEEGHSSWTLFEYPVVVDVDGDGEAEIVLASNDGINPGWQGVTVIGDLSGTWAPTTPTWNQHGYSITNVEDDLSIPAHPTPNWEVGHNSFRAGGLRDHTGNPAPNLRPVVVDLCWDCDAGVVHVAVQVENPGLQDVRAPVDVGLYVRAGGSEALVATMQLASLRSGQASEALLFEIPDDRMAGAEAVVARVDPAGVYTECDETDNDAEEPALECR